MPVALEISADHRIITLTVTDPWTIDELSTWFPLERQYYNESARPIHTLVDVRGMKSVPPRAITGRTSPNLNHPNSGQIVVVGASQLATALLEIAGRLTRNERIKFCRDLDEAQTYLQKLIGEEDNKRPSADT